MNEVVGVHCARELIRLGVPTQSALASLMDELDIDEADARKALRVARSGQSEPRPSASVSPVMSITRFTIAGTVSRRTGPSCARRS
jgi:hypothetical protein